MFKLRMETNNAAFFANPEHKKGYEIVRILKEVTEKVERGYTEGNLHDINGNNVGSWTC